MVDSHGQWDQFAANAELCGIESTLDEELYTTKLNTNLTAEQTAHAARLAGEIDGEAFPPAVEVSQRTLAIGESYDASSRVHLLAPDQASPHDDGIQEWMGGAGPSPSPVSRLKIWLGHGTATPRQAALTAKHRCPVCGGPGHFQAAHVVGCPVRGALVPA